MAMIQWAAPAVALAIGFSGAVALVGKQGPSRSERLAMPLADTMPWLDLVTIDGARVNLHDRIRGRPTAVYVVNTEECASCSNLPLEGRIIGKEFPQLQTIVIGSGSSPDAFARYFSQMGLRSSSLVDPGRALIHALGFAAEPLALLIDSSGRIVLVDSRATSKAAQYPLGRVLRDLGYTLARKGS